jgi:class 3 adenylate cyclase
MTLPADHVLSRLRFAAPPEAQPARPASLLRHMAVLFTDIVGSSAYFKTHGDNAGRRLLARHERIVAEALAAHGGILVKTLGDAAMAYFDDPHQGLRAAVRIQAKTGRSNRRRRPERGIRLRIGLHWGEGIVEARDIFGSVVNQAAKLAAMAHGDEILVTDALLDGIRGAVEVPVRPLTEVRQGGDELQELRLFQVLWGRERSAADGGPGPPPTAVRAGACDPAAAPRGPGPSEALSTGPPPEPHPVCFYCGLRSHCAAACPAKRLAGKPLALGRLARLPVDRLLRLAAAQALPIPEGYDGERLPEGEGDAAEARLAAIARGEILRVCQPSFLGRLWAAGDSLSWDRLRAGTAGERPEGGPRWLALDCLRTGAGERALALLVPLLEHDPCAPGCHGLMGLLQMEGGRCRPAAEALQREMDRSRGRNARVNASLLLARHARVSGQPEICRQRLVEALNILPGCPDALWALLPDKFGRGQTEAALADMQRLIANDQEFFAAAAIDPGLFPFRDAIAPLLEKLARGAGDEAAAALALAAEALKRLEDLAGAESPEAGDLRNLLQSGRSLAIPGSYGGCLEGAGMCRSLQAAVKRSLAERRALVVERLRDMAGRWERLRAEADPVARRWMIRGLLLRAERLEQGAARIREQLRLEPRGLFASVAAELQAMERQSAQLAKGLRRRLTLLAVAAFVRVLLRKLAFFQLLNLAVGLLLLPVGAHYGACFLTEWRPSVPQLWDLQKIALAGGGALGAMLALGGCLKRGPEPPAS